jgi:hypothetical protein
LLAGWGRDGETRVEAGAPGGSGIARSIVLLDDGAVIAGGHRARSVAAGDFTTNDAFLFRLTPAGALDPSFGEGGVLAWDWGFANSDVLFRLVRRANGLLAGCGHSIIGSLRVGGVRQLLAQYATIVQVSVDGRFAPSSHGAGRAIAEVPPNSDCFSVYEDRQGKLVLASLNQKTAVDAAESANL